MALFQSDFALGKKPQAISDSGQVVVEYLFMALTALATNDVVEIGKLPAGHVPVDAQYVSDDLDTNGSPTAALSFGVLNAAKTAIDTSAGSGGAAWATGLTIATTGGMVRQTADVLRKVTALDADRSIGYLATTGAATFAAGTLGVILTYRAARQTGGV